MTRVAAALLPPLEDLGRHLAVALHARDAGHGDRVAEVELLEPSAPLDRDDDAVDRLARDRDGLVLVVALAVAAQADLLRPRLTARRPNPRRGGAARVGLGLGG